MTGPTMASTMQLEFSQAMSDFKTMFPEMEDDVIEAVLRANQGAVDATIDQLLAMTTDYQNERLRVEIELGEGASAQHTPARSVQQTDSTALLEDIDDSAPLSVKKNWTPILLGPLPPTFLRILPSSDKRIDLSLDMDDEKIAAFLQNEEFMTELRWNQEFMAALDSEEGQKNKGPEEEADFKERLRNMGKLSRKKFAQLSRMFSRGGTRKPGPRHPIRGPNDSLLLQEEHSDDEDKQDKTQPHNSK